MNRKELEQYILNTYNAQADFPWAKYDSNEVFRHTGSKKWFALVMDIPKSALGLEGNECVSVVNLKCGAAMSGSLRSENGIFPAYHMNKENWVSVLLDGAVSDDKLKMLVDISYEMTLSLKENQRRKQSSENR